MSGTKAIIVDLDGTLYNTAGRSALIEARDWDGFHAASISDPPNSDVITMLRAVDNGYPGELIFISITGRNERYREITIQWLLKHKVNIDTLWMRGDDDYRSDTEVKEALLRNALSHHELEIEDILFAVDDRDKVVDHFRSLGIPTYQVRHGTY